MRSKNKSKNELVQAILDVYQPKTAKDMQDALKDVFGPMFEAMLQGEMNSHLGGMKIMIRIKNLSVIEEMVIYLKILKQVWEK